MRRWINGMRFLEHPVRISSLLSVESTTTPWKCWKDPHSFIPTAKVRQIVLANNEKRRGKSIICQSFPPLFSLSLSLLHSMTVGDLTCSVHVSENVSGLINLSSDLSRRAECRIVLCTPPLDVVTGLVHIMILYGFFWMAAFSEDCHL